MKNIIIVAMLAAVAPVSAQSVEQLIPTATPFVTDAGKLFTLDEIASMNVVAKRTQTTLGGDIAVLTLSDIGDHAPATVAMTAGRTWKVGGKAAIGSEQRNLGVVILLVPRTNEHKGECFVATGRGAEGFITDGTAARLCEKNIPLLKEGKYGEAVTNMVVDVAALMDEHINPPPPPEPIDINWTLILSIVSVIGVAGGLFVRRSIRKSREIEHARKLQWEQMTKQNKIRDAENARLSALHRAEVARLEQIRWDSLTPLQQIAELAKRERDRIAAEKQYEIDRKKRAEREKQEQEEAESRRSRYDSYDSSSSSSSYDSGGSSSFGGAGGFSGGGGGRSF